MSQVTYSNVAITKVLLLRGNTIQNARYLGLPGEPTIDLEAKTLRIHDGVTVGGHEIESTANLSSYSGNIIPSANNVYSLGSITNQWQHLYVSSNTIYIGGTPLTITNGNLTVGGNVVTGSGGGNVANLWNSGYTVSLASDGTTTFPNNLNFAASQQLYVSGNGNNNNFIGFTANNYNDINGIQIGEVNQGATIYTSGAVQLYTNTASASALWAFNTDGTTTFPDTTVQTTAFSNAAVSSYLADTTLKTFGDSVTITGNLTVQGNIIFNGNATLVSTNNLIINDNIIYIANANPGSSLDIGIAGHFTSTRYQHTGLVRQASTNQWQLFSNVVPEPGGTIDFTNAIYDDIRVGNITSPTIIGINANVIAANTGIKGYVDLANTIQSAQVNAANLAITSANVGIKGYIDLANTIQSAQLTAANVAWQANSYQQQALIGNLQASAYSNINVAAYLSSIGVGGGNYSNVNVAAYLTTNSYLTSNLANLSNYAYAANVTSANVGLKGYVDQANSIQSAQMTAANVGIIGYIDQGNTIQAAAITAANVGMLGYVNSQSFYSNVKVSTYLPTYSGNIAANISKAGHTWTFDSTGLLTVPGDIYFNNNSGVIEQGANRLTITGNAVQVNTGAYFNDDGEASIFALTSVQIATNTNSITNPTWTFGTDGKLTFAGTLTNGATFDGNDFTAAPNSFVEFAGYTGNTYVGLDNDSVFIQTNWNTAGKQWTFGTDGTTLFPDAAIDGGTAPIELKSRSWSQLTYNNSDMNQQPNKNHSTTFFVEGGDALLEIFRWDSGNVMQHRQWTFSSDGSLSLPDTGSLIFPDNTVQTTAYTGAGSYSNVDVANYLPTYSGNVANIRLGNSGVLTFADGTTQTTAGGGGGTNYSNSNVASYLISSNATFIGNTGNVSSVYPLQSNITQVFIGPQTALVSGNANVTTTSWLLNNLYFNSVGNIVVRNTQTGYSYMYMGGAAGVLIGGSTGAATANANVGVLAPWATISSTGVTTTGTTTTNGITTTAALAVNSALGITSNQATQLIFNQTVTTISMGTGAATTINLGTTAAPTSNVFVGGTLGTNVYGLTLRANGQFNLVTSLNSSGGYGTATYTGIPVTGGSGNGMIISMTGVASGYLSTASITNPGTGYRSGDAITIPAGNPVGSLGGSFVLQNYHATRSNIGTGIWQLGIDGNLTLAGNVIFPSNSYIFGDFSNATVNARTVFTPSAANASPGIYAAPSGSGTGASWQAANSGNLTAASKILIATNGSTDVQLVSGINGTGTYLPLSFYNNGAAQMQLTVAGNLNMTVNNSMSTSGTGNFIGNAVGTTATYTGNITALNIFGNISSGASGNLNVVGNLISTGYGYFPGAYNESATTSGVFIGNTGSGTPSPRIGFYNGNVSQNWQVDNYFGQFRWFTPGVTQMNLDNTGSLTVTGNLIVNGAAGISQPTRPAFRIYGQGGSIGLNANLTATNWTVDYSQGNVSAYLNGTNGTFTAPVAGLYQTSLTARTTSNTNGSIIQAVIQQIKSGSASVAMMIEWGANTTFNHASGSTTVKLAAGDKLYVTCLASGAPNGTGFSFDGNDHWDVVYLG